MKYILVIDTVHGQKSCTNLMLLMKNIYPTTIIPFTGAFWGPIPSPLLRWCHRLAENSALRGVFSLLFGLCRSDWLWPNSSAKSPGFSKNKGPCGGWDGFYHRESLNKSLF